MCSLLSANGPSVISMSPSWTRTTVAVLGGWSPPANTHAPADWSSLLNAATPRYAFCAASGGGGALPSTECTLSMYCFIEGSLFRRSTCLLAGPPRSCYSPSLLRGGGVDRVVPLRQGLRVCSVLYR